MRIAIDARMYGPEQFSGIGNYIKNLTDHLFKIDQENEYVLFLKQPQFLISNFESPRVKKVLVTSKHYSYAEQFKLPFEFAREKFDLIHYPHFNSPIFFNRPSVCTIHDTTPFYFPGHKMGSPFRRWAHRQVFNATIRKAEKIITISEFTKQEILKIFPINPDKISITYEGVDDNFKIIENSDIINKIKGKFGIHGKYIFFVGVWRNHKNIENLIRAFNLVKNKYKIEHQLVLGGREDLHYTRVREEINNSPYKKDIIATGYIDNNDLPILYSGADLFVIPSFIEGFGLIAIEAQNCGCPVIASKTSCLPEILQSSALYFDPNKPEEIAEKIFQVVNDNSLRQSLIVEGGKNTKRFSWQKCAEETLAIYKQILK